jgi:biopolymer transport protein TolQ
MDEFGRELLNAIENAALLTPVAPPQPPEDPAQPRRRTF